ncbi:MAG: hypothetical protein JXQ71_17400 [Verrucomicrobia bacterium]|nr:hypothetical protein [Verrucomicrobiota bacterium]
MRIAIPVLNQHISPVLDWAERLLMVDVVHARETGRQWVLITEDHPTRRTEQLVNLGVDVLICGALTRYFEDLLAACPIRLWPRRCGDVEEVLAAFLHGDLDDHRFCLPGCCPGHPRRRRREASRKSAARRS